MTTISGKVTGAGGSGFSSEIRIEGLEQTIAALRAIEPEALKVLQKEITEALNKVKAAASGSAPPPATGQYVIRRSLRGRRAGARLMAAEKWTAVFEFAGTRMRSRTGGPITPQGAAMVRWLDGFGKPGRFLWAAWDANKVAFEAELKAAFDKAEATLQRKLNAAGEVF